ncbi:uncharacterized protein LOC123720423 [Pieris brassicae]|uniref:uncharacterized protein LOC123720423 n=1 Tax=Pieris brassicae TaxID=7116 RepID=UPI001E65E490|nr:uncharacterized protein LOC123720423 [Pieris brassicae]
MSLLDSPHFKILVDLIPKYDGTKKLLNFYIREVENVLEQIEVAGRNHPTLLSVIKSKLSGAAVEAIAYETNLDTWNNIKTALIRRLGEPRNEIQVMQELTRSRKFKNENAESFGKRLRELLDTLLSIGNHANKGYYEEMVIEQYVNNLDFHVSLGVRIAKPDTLEMAIVAARQEEARLALNKPGPSTFYNVYRTKAMSSQILVRRKPNTTRIFTKLRERKIGGSENQRPKYRPSTVHRAAGVSRILIAGAIMLCSRGDVILNPVNNNPGILLLKQGR